ncbi:MAG TPA: pilus assembly protein TadG-related protein [Candidatus Binatia bacterium]|nr:pilus assembly protein TadG-related protein [Candidatus Binatia bacterium]
MSLSTRNRRRGEEGMALLYVAVFLLVSLWFVSLAIDVGKLMAAKTELQAAADAAALAGASAIDPLTAQLNVANSKARAAATAAANHAYQNVKTSVVINPDTDVEFPGVRKVKVSVYRDADHGNSVMLHFAQTLGLRFMNVRANATAEVGPLTDVCEGLAPFAPEKPSYGDFSKSCDSTYTLTMPVGASQQGNFQFLDFDNCVENDSTATNKGGAAELAYYILNGYDCCFHIGDMTESATKPGLNLGPIRDALQERFDRDTDKREGICYQQYTGNQSRVFLTPIVATFSVNGKKMVKVLKFAAFFMQYRPPNDLNKNGFKGQFIDYIAVGTVDSEIPPDSTAVYGVHLIE